MATSGSTDWSLNSRQVITAALELIGVVPIGDTPAPEHAARAMTDLNLMLKTWGTAAKLWIMTEGSVVLLASTASYALSAARRVLSVRRRTSDIDTPLTEWSREEYYDFPSKTSTGLPNSYYFDPQRATRTLYVWPVPDATVAASTTLQYTYARVLEDVDALDNDADVPQEWLEALTYSLAARLIVPFRMHLTDPVGAAEIKERAATLYAQLSADSQEDVSVFFSPSSH